MDFPFRRRNPMEDSYRLLFYPVGKQAFGNQPLDFGIVTAMLVLFVRMAFGSVIVVMILVMFVVVGMLAV